MMILGFIAVPKMVKVYVDGVIAPVNNIQQVIPSAGVPEVWMAKLEPNVLFP